MGPAGHWSTDWPQDFLTDFPQPITEQLLCARLCAKSLSAAHFRDGATGSGREGARLRSHNQEVDELGTHAAIPPPGPHPSPALTELTMQAGDCAVSTPVLMQPRRERVLQNKILLGTLAPLTLASFVLYSTG